MSKKELIYYLFQKRGIKTEIPWTDDDMDKLTPQFKNLHIPQTDGMDKLTQQFKNLNIGPAGRIPQTYEMDKLTQQFKHLNIGHAGRIPQMHPSSRVYESAAAQFAYPQVPKKWEDLKPHARMPRRKPKQEPRRRSRSPSNVREN
jgi:hypothetical protein